MIRSNPKLRSSSVSVAALVSLLVVPSGFARAKPDSTNGIPEPSAKAILADLPFENDDVPYRVFVNLAPDGQKPFILMLDTGASHSVLTPGAARDLGVTIRRDRSTPYRKGTRLGRDLQFYVDVDSSDTGSKTGWEYGLLGGNFLAEYVLEIDFIERRVRFLDPRKYKLPKKTTGEHEAIIPIQVRSNRPYSDIEMNGRKLNLLLDTGAPPPLIISGTAAKKLGIDVDALPDLPDGGTAMGPMKVRLHQTPRLSFAGYELGGTPVLVAPKRWYNLAGATDSVLGYALLEQFVIRIDYRSQRMWLKRKRFDESFAGYHSLEIPESGALIIPGDLGFVVMSVVRKSPAGELGLERGDVINPERFEGSWTLARIDEHISAKLPLMVLRPGSRAKDMDKEVKLPNASAYDQRAAKKKAEVAVMQAEQQQAHLEQLAKERDESLFGRTSSGGWQLIEGVRKRRGPKEGEVWVNYEEMKRIKAEEATEAAAPEL